MGSRLYSAALMALPTFLPAPRRMLALGWLGFMVYAFPGFMSFDSVYQLRQARWGYLTDSHPPFMAALWAVVEVFITGPIGMLVIQSAAFLAGAYLVLCQVMAPRRAALGATLILWFPPIASFMAVIWKDSQMAGFLLLGFGLMLQPTRRSRLLALAALLVATLMRHNALTAVAPLVIVCWSWNPEHRGLRRYVVAVGAWVGVTLAAYGISNLLVDEHRYPWHAGPALMDIAGTLRNEPVIISDAQLHQMLPGVVFRVENAHAYLRDSDLHGGYMKVLLAKASRAIKPPTNAAERAAIARAWQTLVLGHPIAYANHRWGITRRLLGFTPTAGTPIYNDFTDIQDLSASAEAIDHDAAPSRVQNVFRKKFQWLAKTIVFWLPLYLFIVVAMIPLAFKDRRILALLASGVASEAALAIFAPTTDWRYSSWFVVVSVVAFAWATAVPWRRQPVIRAQPHTV